MRSHLVFYSHANKTHFHKKDFALSLVLKVKVFGTRKWPIIAIFIEISEFLKTRSLFNLVWNFQVRVVRRSFLVHFTLLALCSSNKTLLLSSNTTGTLL